MPQSPHMRLGRFLYKAERVRLALYDFAGLDAAGADAHTLADAVRGGLDGLQIDVPAAAGGVVGVRDVVAELRAFAAKITFLCHDLLRPESLKSSTRRHLPFEQAILRNQGCGSGRHERIRTADLYRVKVAL